MNWARVEKRGKEIAKALIEDGYSFYDAKEALESAKGWLESVVDDIKLNTLNYQKHFVDGALESIEEDDDE